MEITGGWPRLAVIQTMPTVASNTATSCTGRNRSFRKTTPSNTLIKGVMK